MKKFFKENWSKVLLVIVAFAIVLFVSLVSGKNTNESKTVFVGQDLSAATQITCTYPEVLNVNYFDNQISHVMPKKETNPLIFTFSELSDPKVGQLSYLDTTRSITNVPILKLLEDEEKIIYVDGTGENYLSIHSIYKESGVSTYTKSVSLFGIPSGSLSMGSCVGY